MAQEGKPVIYLASPYSHPDPAVRQCRFELACMAAARRMERGLIVYSPIAHSHPIEQFMAQQQSHEFWMDQCMALLRRADSMGCECAIGEYTINPRSMRRAAAMHASSNRH
jgi:nucleoside 2-deoxyribosyltransferase